MTVPKAVREALGLQRSDLLSWEEDDGSVRGRAISPLDRAFLQALEAGLQEWNSAVDEAAFAHL
ncbi:MAG: AbrB/MazE/SpoVT family DNA-binding domain-containing protein [Vulcanococcus sp.]